MKGITAGGIIPAYAGSTTISTCGAGTHADHPRIRGEHRHRSREEALDWGSSPHTRGARVVVEQAVVVGGIIPAYAGSTEHGEKHLGAATDHPRIRGEHITRAGRLRPPRGSSPHTRGAQQLALMKPGDLVDHPRIRGEHPLTGSRLVGGGGSSPHTRGARGGGGAVGDGVRIIPAYAGSTVKLSYL